MKNYVEKCEQKEGDHRMLRQAEQSQREAVATLFVGAQKEFKGRSGATENEWKHLLTLRP